MELYKGDEPKKLTVKIANEGNIDGFYLVKWRNDFLKIYAVQPVLVPPGKDTVIYYTLKVAKNGLDDFNSQGVSCTVFDTNRNSKSLVFNLYNVTHQRKAYASPYKTMKVNLSSGYMQYGNIRPTYYFSSNGSLDIDKNTYLNYNYQSKQYNTLNQFQRDLFSVNLHHKKWDLNVGQVQNAQYFISVGNGVQLTYTGEKAQYKAWANKHYNASFFPNDNAGVSAVHTLSKMKLQTDLAVDRNSNTKNTAGVLINKLEVIKTEKGELAISGGLGLDYSSRTVHSPNALSTSFGYSGSYNAFFGIGIRSSLLKNSLNFPGIQAGLFRQYHEIRKQLGKKTAVSIFYQYNSITRNFLRDSLYNTDIFDYNTERYGLNYSKAGRYDQLRINAGIMRQTFAAGFVPNYNFMQLFYNYNKKDFSISFSTINAINSRFKKLDFISNTNLLVGYKYGGLTAIYTKVLNNPVVDASQDKFEYSETINLSPFVRFALLKTIGVVINYNASKMMNNDFIMQFVGGSVNYNGLRNGLNFSLNASIPVKSYNNNAYTSYYALNYFNVTLSKSFNVPISPKKQRYNLELDMFYDENNNGRKDKKEKAVDHMPVKINTVRFRSKEGAVAYKNVDPSKYELELDANAAREGYVPKNGSNQTVRLSRDKKVKVPFVKSKVIKGVIQIILDTNSRKSISAEKMKVILFDMRGNIVQTTIANYRGEYLFNAPAGIYKVSLNAAAFNDDYKPEVMHFTADLTKKEREEVNFVIRQKKRKVNIRQTTLY